MNLEVKGARGLEQFTLKDNESAPDNIGKR